MPPYHGSRPPFRLPSDVVYFHDWRYVDHGSIAWVGAGGENAPLVTREPCPEMRYQYRDMPLGVRIVARPARRGDPVLTPADAGVPFLSAGTLIRDGGMYRLWYECVPEETLGTPEIATSNRLRYAESDDGVAWRMPALGIAEYRGNARNNIVLDTTMTGGVTYNSGCVFIDPDAPASERYKGFFLGYMPDDMWAEYRRTRPDDIDPFIEVPQGLFGAVSPDGLRWTAIRDPLVAQNSDTHNICAYDTVTKRYVAYCRAWYYNRRTISCAVTDDFRRFPLPQPLFWPNAMMEPFDLWYVQPKTLMPGTVDWHVMFPMRWSIQNDTFSFHMATSPDGLTWGFVPDADGRNAPVCTPDPLRTPREVCVIPGLGLVDLPGDRTGMLVTSWPVPHKHPRKPPMGFVSWAWWSKDRLVALEAPTEGSFILWPIATAKRTIRLNVRTAFTGYVEVEVCAEGRTPIPGRTFSECDRISGDHFDRVVTWRGESDLGNGEGQPVRLRFRMRNAELYAVRFA